MPLSKLLANIIQSTRDKSSITQVPVFLTIVRQFGSQDTPPQLHFTPSSRQSMPYVPAPLLFQAHTPATRHTPSTQTPPPLPWEKITWSPSSATREHLVQVTLKLLPVQQLDTLPARHWLKFSVAQHIQPIPVETLSLLWQVDFQESSIQNLSWQEVESVLPSLVNFSSFLSPLKINTDVLNV